VSIYLIRHGETALNRAQVVQPAETPLGEHGVAQAQLLAARLAGAGIAEIVSSDLPRTQMTAAPLAAATGLPLSLDADLQERNFGHVRGTPYAELASRRIELFAPGYEPPGGESWETFHLRVDRAWASATARARSLAAAGSGHLAVVTHGLVCHSIVARLVERPERLPSGEFGRDGPPIRFGNTAVSILSEGGDGRFSIELFACTAHLDEATDASVA